MAEIRKITYQLRRDYADRWREVNPTLKAGEPGFELDTGKLKIGDGVTPYIMLNYLGEDIFEVSADEQSIVFKDEMLKLAGFDAAESGTYPIKGGDGKLSWVMPFDPTSLQNTVGELTETVGSLSDAVTTIQTEVNKTIKTISLNGTLLSAINGNVDIAVPIVKDSDEITVNADGSLNIKQVDLDKIVQNEETVLIMDGGTSE